jgi:HD-like signal output (HDOD) protein
MQNASVPGESADLAFERVAWAIEEQLTSGVLELPVLPQIAAQVLALASSSSSSASQLSNLIHTDQSLAGNVLRIANSSAYMPSSPIVSLQQAVARLGTTQLTELAFAVSVKSGAFKAPGYTDVVADLWRSSVATGAWAKEVARSLRRNVESAFLCGLLVGVGQPMVLRVASDAADGEIIASEGLLELFRRFETPVGAQLAARWGLPDAVRAVITTRGDVAADQPFSTQINLTRAATVLAQSEDTPESCPAFVALNMYPEDIAKIAGRRPVVDRFIDGMSL